MASMTFKDIKDLALDLADVTGDAHIDSVQFAKHANFQFARLHDIVVNADQRYLVSSKTFTMVSGQREYPLPKDFYKSIKVYHVDTNGIRHPMERLPLRRIDDLYDCDVGIPMYTFMGSKMVVSRDITGSVEMRYVPKFLPLQNDNDLCNVDIPESWTYYVVLRLAIYLRQRSDLDTVDLKADLAELRRDLENVAEDRDTGEADAQVDVYRFTHRARRTDYWE